MAVTIRDVARAAGVSPSTVSRALTVPEKVDQRTRERILDLATELGYRPNRAARSLITGRTGNLGLLVPDLANPFFPGLVKAIQARALESDYQLFVVDTDEDAAIEPELVRQLAKQVDGLLLCSPRMKAGPLREAAEATPTVLVNRALPKTSSITFDNAEGAAALIAHLSGLGHRRIGFLGGPAGSWSGAQRLRGVRSACAVGGLQLSELGHFAPAFEGGKAAVEFVLVAPVTAVVAYNDLVAIGLCEAVAERGVLVPAQLSVAGFDNIPMAGMIRPSLTTVTMPLARAGALAVDVLLAQLADPEPKIRQIRVPTKVQVRGSTGITSDERKS